ncbi:DNA polymerase III subunit epsilon [Arboricoccus pini]|uniref:DNA polymerase III subunit epsilon n=1 Tax=Arboricoccus pini TaxID=1963835 RepID=UPI000B503C19|nr:DNA polymerase III subunit epsilon [Arboricoccus pini]
MREIVMDTETTGLDPNQGHRLVELGAVELINHVPTGRTFHRYINPERDMPEEAQRIHGLSAEFLSAHPVFAASEVVDEFIAFIADSALVIHNAAFDMRFINAEFARCGRPLLHQSRAIDTLTIAQRRFPGAPNSLDALCRRFGVDNSARTKHGALLDSEILAEVYLHLLGGRQVTLGLMTPDVRANGGRTVVRNRHEPRIFTPSVAELEAHEAFIGKLKHAIWLQ